MGSFYGNYGGSGGGSGGTTNYNELSNKPIINLNGLPNSPTILYSLTEGEYMVSGYYKYNNIESSVYYMDSWHITVEIDEFTQQKNIYYARTEGNSYVVYDIIYHEDSEEYDIVRNEFKKDISFLDELPQDGEENKLYVTLNGIYIYRESAFVLMSSSSDAYVPNNWGVF